jgi:transcriptional regulator
MKPRPPPTDAKFDLLPGTLEMMVLKTLTAGPRHGYAVMRRILDRSGDLLRVEEGSLYPALHRMERRGWIEAEWGQSESNRRAKFYSLTRRGRTELAAQTDSWQRMAGAIAQVMQAAVPALPPTGRG